MGVSSKTLESIYARPVTADAEPEMYDWGNLKQSWCVDWRDPADRKGRIVCAVMFLLRLMRLPSTAWLHRQAICSSEEIALTFSFEFEKRHGGRCSIYPMPVDHCLPATPIRPKWLYSPTARGQKVLEGTLEVIEKHDRETLLRILRETVNED